MTEEKKCPFNNFDACIGDECAFHMGTMKVEIDEEKGTLSSLMPSFPCAVSVFGAKAIFDYFGLKFCPSMLDK